MGHAPVRTAVDLNTLDPAELLEGFLDGMSDAPEPGDNRSRAYWHGWRVGMMDKGRIEIDPDHRALVRDVAPNGVLKISDDRRRT